MNAELPIKRFQMEHQPRRPGQQFPNENRSPQPAVHRRYSDIAETKKARLLTVADDYARQYEWRSWDTILSALPNLNGQVVLDLGCGIGDRSRDLSAKGARVIGVDANDDLLEYARAHRLTNVEVQLADLKTFGDPDIEVDGIWASLTAAYFPRLSDSLYIWQRHLPRRLDGTHEQLGGLATRAEHLQSSPVILPAGFSLRFAPK